jgi:hypothetical protein
MRILDDRREALVEQVLSLARMLDRPLVPARPPECPRQALAGVAGLLRL